MVGYTYKQAKAKYENDVAYLKNIMAMAHKGKRTIADVRSAQAQMLRSQAVMKEAYRKQSK